MSLLKQVILPVNIHDADAQAKQKEHQQKLMGKMFFQERTKLGAQKCQGPGADEKGCEQKVAANKLYCWTCYNVLVNRWHEEQKQGAESAESNNLVHDRVSSNSHR